MKLKLQLSGKSRGVSNNFVVILKLLWFLLGTQPLLLTSLIFLISIHQGRTAKFQIEVSENKGYFPYLGSQNP